MTFQWPNAGQYRVSVGLTDVSRAFSETSLFVTVMDGAFNGKDYRYDALELLSDKPEYAPGDEVELLIQTNREGSTVVLSVYGKQADPLILKLEGKTLMQRIKLREADQPNLEISAYTVSDAQLHQASRSIIIPPSRGVANIAITTDSKTYQPRGKVSAKLKVTDALGAPVVGSIVISAYDKALEYISGGSNIGDVRKAFWGWKNYASPAVSSTLRALDYAPAKEGEVSMESLTSGDRYMAGVAYLRGGGDAPNAKSPVMVAPPPAPSDGRSARGLFGRGDVDSFALAEAAPSAENAPAMIRTNLADSAVWVASLSTDKQGEADFTFDMPDNLTTWKLRGWVLGHGSQVGEAQVELITRKDLMVRLQAPRFFLEKDEVTISSNIHNETDAVLTVRPSLEFDKALVAIIGEASKPTVTIPAHGETRVDWRLRILRAGQLTLTAKALSETASDAVQMTYPIYEHGVYKTDSWSLSLRPDQNSGKITFTVPEDRKSETAKLELRWSPALAMACVDALPYLASYPHGCAEQTLNRFVPTVITLDLLRKMGLDLNAIRDQRSKLNAQSIARVSHDLAEHKDAVFDESKVARMAAKGLKNLLDAQREDGAWSWFPGAKEGSAHITALVYQGLVAARNAGMQVEVQSLANAAEWLKDYETANLARLNLDPKNKSFKAAPDHTDALVHCALVMGKEDSSPDMRTRLYEARNNLSRLVVGQLGLAFDQLGENERRDMCLRNLRQYLQQDADNQTAWLKLPKAGFWHWWGDEMETQAVFLKLLSKTEPKGELAAALAKYLVNNRRHGSYWNSTRDTATVVDALATYAMASGEAKPEFTAEILLDGKVVKTSEITADNLFTFDGSFLVEGEALTAGKHSLEIRKQGTGALYANAAVSVFTKEAEIPAAGLELKVRRRYSKVVTVKGKTTRTELKSGDPVQSGDRVEVELTVESKNDYEYLLLSDAKPAGYEAVDLRSGWVYEGLYTYREFRDEAVNFYLSALPQGIHSLRYEMRAEVPGIFSGLPSTLSAMYVPELRGNAAEWKTVVTESE